MWEIVCLCGYHFLTQVLKTKVEFSEVKLLSAVTEKDSYEKVAVIFVCLNSANFIHLHTNIL